MNLLDFDQSLEPPAPVLPVRIAGIVRGAPAALLRMLVDTGADCTLIPLQVAKALRLPIVDRIEIVGVGSKAQAAAVHAARIRVGPLRTLARVVALGDEALLGRDVLNRLILQLDGPAQTIDLSMRGKRRRR